jgi:hypothetical protein
MDQREYPIHVPGCSIVRQQYLGVEKEIEGA